MAERERESGLIEQAKCCHWALVSTEHKTSLARVNAPALSFVEVAAQVCMQFAARECADRDPCDPRANDVWMGRSRYVDHNGHNTTVFFLVTLMLDAYGMRRVAQAVPMGMPCVGGFCAATKVKARSRLRTSPV